MGKGKHTENTLENPFAFAKEWTSSAIKQNDICWIQSDLTV